VSRNKSERFSHVANFTDYMAVALRSLEKKPPGLRILDLPAGNGLLADALRTAGHEVVCADINRERPDYVYADMAEPLPFADAEFDAALCLEGLEHLVDPVRLIAELARVVRPGGTVVVTTPNVINFYSRLQYLFTGVPYQFNPAAVPVIAAGDEADRGHVFPLSYFQLRYLFEHYGLRTKEVLGDRYKRKALMPLYALLLPVAWLWSWVLFTRQGDRRQTERNRTFLADAFSAPLLFSRSLILVLEKDPSSYPRLR
jgi:SAM-dependent methyltransferase